MFQFLDHDMRLLAQLLYGTGMRLMDGLRLRIKDVDFDRHVVVFREAKGNKDRVVMLPRSLAHTCPSESYSSRVALSKRSRKHSALSAASALALSRAQCLIEARRHELEVQFQGTQPGCVVVARNDPFEHLWPPASFAILVPCNEIVEFFKRSTALQASTPGMPAVNMGSMHAYDQLPADVVIYRIEAKLAAGCWLLAAGCWLLAASA